jgi:hypothetical protein
MQHASETLAATPNIVLKHPNKTLAIRMKQMKHSKHAYETLAKKHLKTLHTCETYATTYATSR